MTTTSDYWVGATIGEGSYGKVVHARHKITNRNFAIKVMTKQSIQKNPALLSEIWKERELLKTLKSDHVVSLWASFHDSECIYFVMECLAGGDLAHVIQCGQHFFLEWSLAIPSYTLQLISALEFIHSRRVIHADLKPENVLVSTRGRIKLADFGSAVELNNNRPITHDSIRCMGTADYASPEVVRGLTSLSFGIDLWSLGCVLYAMWEGVSPFHDSSDALAVQKIVGHSNEGHLKSKNMMEVWETLVHDLLAPEASNRLGMADIKLPNSDGCVVYTSIRERPCLSTHGGGNEVSFRAPAPSWWNKALTHSLRDGAEGWGMFLLS